GAVQPPGPVHHRLPGDDGGELHGDAAADDPVHRAAATRDRGARPLGHEGVSGRTAQARMLWARVNAASPRIRIAKARCSGSAGTRVARRAARNAAPTVAMAKVAVRPQSSCAVPQCETRPAAALTTVTASEVPTARLKGRCRASISSGMTMNPPP